jgi:hypothetical protein
MADSPFDAAYHRLRRGREHIAELKVCCDEVGDQWLDRLAEQFHFPVTMLGEDLLGWFDQRFPEERIPAKLPILVGEAVYNLRAALDYLTGALSRIDTPGWPSGRKRRNQFPIEHTRIGFTSRRDTFLAGVSDAHVAEIEGYQPFSGCDWTGRLARLSNMDKHNQLVVVLQGITLQAEGQRLVLSAPLTMQDVLAQPQDEEHPAVATINDLAVNVSNLLDRFA